MAFPCSGGASVIVCQGAIYSEAQCQIAESRFAGGAHCALAPGDAGHVLCKFTSGERAACRNSCRSRGTGAGLHMRDWVHRRSKVMSLKIFEPVALCLRRLAESDRERQGSYHGSRVAWRHSAQSRWTLLVRLNHVAARSAEVDNFLVVSDTTAVSHSTAAPTLGDTAAVTANTGKASFNSLAWSAGEWCGQVADRDLVEVRSEEAVYVDVGGRA